MLEGAVVSLGPLEREHLQAWRGWVNDPEIAALVDRILPVTQAEHERFFERYVCDNTSAVWFSIRDNESDRYVGNAWLWNINTRNRSAELRILIGERDMWNRGAGSESIALLSDFALHRLGLHKIYAYVMERNPRARRAFEKALFSLEARLAEETFWEGRYTDVLRMCRIEKTPR